MRRCRDFRRGMRRRVSGLAWRRRSFGSGEFARAAGAQAGSAAPLEARSASGLSAGAGCTDARPDDQRAAPRCRAGCACEPATQWTFLDRCGLAFKKDRPCERAGSAGHPEAAAGLVRSSAGCRSAPSRLHRRDLAFHDHGSSPWLKSVRSSRPNSPPGDIVVLDNLGSHKGAGVRAAIAAAGCDPVLSPALQPQLQLRERLLETEGSLAQARRSNPRHSLAQDRCHHPRRRTRRTRKPLQNLRL